MHDDWGRRTPRWAGIRSQVIEVCGVSVHVLRAGDQRPGTPQLLVHGLGGSSGNWLEVMPGLAERGPVVAPDLPGFGRTRPPRPTATHVRANARFLVALLDGLGWDRVELHGNSMGGLLAVLVASADQHRVRRLVLSSPALPVAPGTLDGFRRETVTRFGPFLLPGLGVRLVRRMHARLSPEELATDTASYVHAEPARLSPESAAVTLENVVYGRQEDWRLPGFVAAAESVVRAVVRRRRLERAVAAITSPTLVLWGDRDRLIGRRVIDRLEARRPDWTVRILEGVGHAAMLEAPHRYLATVTDWSQPAASGGRAMTTRRAGGPRHPDTSRRTAPRHDAPLDPESP